MNHFLRAVMLMSLAGMPTVATAQPIYKCKANNSMIEYSQSACRGELIAVIYPDRGPTEADHQRALARIAAETARLRAQDEAAAELRAANHAA